MHSPLIPLRRATIGAAAAFVGTTPRAIRHYHEIGLLPEPERGGDDRRRYGYPEMVRLLWIRTMADAGIALDDIRDAFLAADADSDDVAGILERLERTLLDREAELQRQRTAVQRMRTRGSRIGLLPEVVGDRLAGLPEGSVRPADVDGLLVTERILGPLAAAVRATRVIALTTHPGLRQESDRVDAAEEALDETVGVDDPRVAEVAARRHAFEHLLDAVVEESGLADADEALLDSWDDRDPPACAHDGDGSGRRAGTSAASTRATAAVDTMAADFSPARLRCAELVEELAARG